MIIVVDGKRWVVFVTDSFLQNAGLVGLVRLLEFYNAVAGVDYRLERDRLLVELDYFLRADWATLFRDALIDAFDDDTGYGRALAMAGTLRYRLEQENPSKDDTKKTKKMQSDIVKTLSVNSYKTAYETLAARGVPCAVPNRLADFKKNGDLESLARLEEALAETEVKKLLCFKSVAYTRINMLWDGKSFLLPANAKKDMVPLYRADFVTPLRNFLKDEDEKKKRKDTCIACGDAMHGSEKTSLAFAKDMADDLGRKKSSLWHCEVDMFLCPACAFLYSLAPLGFVPVGRDMCFINQNDSMESLVDLNRPRLSGEEGRNIPWRRALNRIIALKLRLKEQELKNIRVILRRRQEERYDMRIIGKDVLAIANESQKNLAALENRRNVNHGKISINVYEEVVDNLFQCRDQEALIRLLFKLSLEDAEIVSRIYDVLMVHHYQRKFVKTHHLTQIELKHNERGGIALNAEDLKEATNSGYYLRMHIAGREPGKADKVDIADKADMDDKAGKDNKVEERVRGLVYQLLNSLTIRDKKGFLDKLLRVCTGYDIRIPNAFLRGIDSEDDFFELGYHFLLGLKGGYVPKNDETKTKQGGTDNGK